MHCCMSDLGFGSHKDHKGHKDYGTMHLFVPFVAKLTSPYKSKCCRPACLSCPSAYPTLLRYCTVSVTAMR